MGRFRPGRRGIAQQIDSNGVLVAHRGSHLRFGDHLGGSQISIGPRTRSGRPCRIADDQGGERGAKRKAAASDCIAGKGALDEQAAWRASHIRESCQLPGRGHGQRAVGFRFARRDRAEYSAPQNAGIFRRHDSHDSQSGLACAEVDRGGRSAAAIEAGSERRSRA